MLADYAEALRQLRLACAPAAGDPAASLKVCTDCAADFWDWTDKWRRYCADCGALRQRGQQHLAAAQGRTRRG